MEEIGYGTGAELAPLGEIVVLDLSSSLAGAYCTKMFADAGARVVMVEPPGGSSLRWSVKSHANLSDGEDAGLFRYLAASKASVVADLSTDPGRCLVADLVREADLLVETSAPGYLERVGLGREVLQTANPSLVMVSISTFGQSGPWAQRRATEFTLQGWCGSIAFRGTPERPPLSAGGEIGEYLGGAVAAAAGMACYRHAKLTGVGDHVDVSLLECMTAGYQAFEWLHTALMGLPSISRSIEFPSIEQVKDGWVGFSMVTGQQWADFAAMVGHPEMAEDPELRLMLGRWPRRDEVRDAIRPWLSSHSVAEVLETAAMYRIPAAPIGNGSNLTQIDHFAARQVFVENPGGFLQPRTPWRISGANPVPPGRAPSIGEHQGSVGEIVRFAGFKQRRGGPYARSSQAPARGEAVSTRKLEGLRVIDLTAFWAGPSATQVLAALGADVVKVESIQRPDGIRFAGGQVQGASRWWEYGWLFQGVNVDKRGITLNLASTRGRELLYKLVSNADVVMENFSPRVTDQLGLDYETLSRINPRVIMVRMPAFGLDGPWRDRVGFGPTMEQASGMAWVTGYADDAPVSPRGPADPLAGYHAVFALLVAIELRDQCGNGSLVEVPMVEVALNVTAEQLVENTLYGCLLSRQGNLGRVAAPQNVYATKGDDRWLALAVTNDDEWRSLCELMGNPEWAKDPKLKDMEGRKLHHDILDEMLSPWLASSDLEDIVERMAEAGIPAAQVVAPNDVITNPQMLARGFFQMLSHPITGPNLLTRPPFLLDDAPKCHNPAPTLGQHNEEVLMDELGLASEEMEVLRDEAVIGDTPVGL
ncbi:MAG: CoA transferase [Actinobacteria bacterium]|nr:CoA transferase [Actinomycetota bacterium]